MLGRLCFSLLVLQTLCYLQVSAQNDPETSVEDEEIAEIGDPPLLNNFNDISVPLVPVEFEIARAGYIPSEVLVAQGRAELHCEGAKEISSMIYWTKNGVRQDNAQFYNEPTESTVISVYKLVDTDEARYGCNGQYLYLVKEKPEEEAQEASIWQNSKVICIDKVVGEETRILEKMTGPYKSSIFYMVVRQQSIYPIKERKITADSVFMCNNTEHFTFIPETRPQTQVECKGEKAVCTNSDTQGRCALTIFFEDKKVAEGRSPVLEHPYGKINIQQQVRCEAACQIGEDFITLPVTDCTAYPAPDECVDKADKYGSEYRGTVSVTKSGLVCQRWDSQSPNVHRRTPDRHPDSGLQENYCRNPGGVNIRGIWCLNGEGTDPVLELCDIPTCSGGDETEGEETNGGEEEAEGGEISSSLGMSIPALPLAFAMILRL